MHDKETGQVMPLGLALLLFAVVTGLMVFDTGQAAVTRMRLSNAADAAAHGGLQWQARALNFTAYTNRAMVANQVSMAQAVSLNSWATYARVASGNIGTVLAPVPYLGQLASAAQSTLAQLEQVISPAASWMLRVIDQANGALSLAQEAMFESALVASRSVVKQVVAANDSRFDVSSGLALASQASNLQQFSELTRRRTATDIDASHERVAIIEASLDEFSRQRSWKLFDRWFPTSPITGMRLHREGQTRLVTRETASGLSVEWKAKDALSLNTRVLTPGGWERSDLPVGWAEAYANSTPGQGSIEPCGSAAVGLPSILQSAGISLAARVGASALNNVVSGCEPWFTYNRTAESLAAAGVPALGDPQPSRSSSHYSGLRAFRNLADQHHDNADPRIELLVEVSVPDADIPSSARRVSGDRLDLPVQSSSGTSSAMSRAELFYQRPDEPSFSSVEPANLYNPYWTVRLKPVPASARLAAMAGRSEVMADQNRQAQAPGTGDWQ